MKMIIPIQTELGKERAEAVVQMNLPVLLFALGVTVLAGVLSGCAPAFQATKLNLSETLKQGSRSVTARGRMKTQQMLVMGEFALAITLLAGAGMALHSFYNLTRIDLGFRPGNILLGQLRPPKNTHPVPDEINASVRGPLAKLDALPGVQNAALSTTRPLEGQGNGMPFNISGQIVSEQDRPVADVELATPSYFQTTLSWPFPSERRLKSSGPRPQRGLHIHRSFVDTEFQFRTLWIDRLRLPRTK